ncbi:hypothetical protein EDD11_002977 [Mortierella claussenii]|nr:hypothetical protein EDD11_002977 [Mortierella claussenii]
MAEHHHPNTCYSPLHEDDQSTFTQHHSPSVDNESLVPDHTIVISDLNSTYGTADSNADTLTAKSAHTTNSKQRPSISRTNSPPRGSDVLRATTMPEGGLSRFRAAGQKVVNTRRMTAYAVQGQGVDASSDLDSIFSCIEATVDVTVMDLNQSRYIKKECLGNSEFLHWLKLPRPAWSKVRWININGMSWDVIKAISIKYNLHHLAVEDLLHVPQRTKVDIYPQQTYVALTLLTLMETMEDGELRQVDPLQSQHGIDPENLKQRMALDKMDHYRRRYPIEDVEGGLKVQMEQVTIFLLEDGTLITLFQVSGSSVVKPIVERLTHDFSIVRKYNDASFLLQSVIDGIVDHAIPITDAFRQEINELEAHVLALPRMKFTKELHQLTAQLSLLKRTLSPTQALVHALRGKDDRSPLSSLSRTYMGDVMDHCNTMVEDIDSMLALCEKLINMIFNIIAYDTNESMKRLALVSIIFLPITFVAGDISYFWIICAVVTAVVALPQKTRNYIQLGAFGAAAVGVYYRDRVMAKVGPARRQANEIAHDAPRRTKT